MGIYIGLDIGGTKFMAASFDENMKIIKRVKYPTPQPLNEGLSLLNRMIEEVSTGDRILGIGAAAGGPMDSKNGIISPLHQIEWRDVPIKSIMEERWKSPFAVDVDTNVAALGEYHLGNYKERYFLYITLSTGMGGGFLIDGKIYEGICHPEIAHQAVNYRCSFPERIECECGAANCLEALVSGNGIRRIYGKPAEELDDREWDEVAYNLGEGLRNIAAILAPEIVVFGGGVSVGAGDKLIKKAEKYMRANLKIVKPPKITISCHGYDTALMGSGYLAMEANRRSR